MTIIVNITSFTRSNGQSGWSFTTGPGFQYLAEIRYFSHDGYLVDAYGVHEIKASKEDAFSLAKKQITAGFQCRKENYGEDFDEIRFVNL